MFTTWITAYTKLCDNKIIFNKAVCLAEFFLASAKPWEWQEGARGGSLWVINSRKTFNCFRRQCCSLKVFKALKSLWKEYYDLKNCNLIWFTKAFIVLSFLAGSPRLPMCTLVLYSFYYCIISSIILAKWVHRIYRALKLPVKDNI